MSATGMDIRGQGPNAGNGVLYADAVAIGPNGVVSPKTVVNTTITFDPPSLTTGAFATSSPITVTGVLLGDTVELYPPYDTQGIMYQGASQAADKITINLTSCALGTVDLPSGTWGVVTKRRV